MTDGLVHGFAVGAALSRWQGSCTESVSKLFINCLGKRRASCVICVGCERHHLVGGHGNGKMFKAPTAKPGTSQI